MIFVALTEAAGKNELLLVDGGMCRFHRRRDGVVVIREIIVLPERRREGIGKRMLDMIRERYLSNVIQAVCPVEYEANKFWKSMNFVLSHRKPGPDGRFLVWQWRIDHGQD